MIEYSRSYKHKSKENVQFSIGITVAFYYMKATYNFFIRGHIQETFSDISELCYNSKMISAPEITETTNLCFSVEIPAHILEIDPVI